MAALIFGTVNPSGKLPVTFPSSLSQVPAQTTAQWPGTSTGVIYSEGVKIGYRWYQSQNITPAFPFGYGLSYTNFSFSNLNVGAFNANGTRDGDRHGHQHRLAGRARRSRRCTSATRPPAGPAASSSPASSGSRSTPGQSATVTFPLTIHDLASWSPTDNQWEAQAGTYGISVGDSSDNRPLSGSTSLAQKLTGQVAAGTSGRGRLAGQHRGQRERHPELGRAGRGDGRRGQPVRLQQPEGYRRSRSPCRPWTPTRPQTLTFTATGLPPGITIASNGTISGSGSTLGTYTVTVTATDTKGVSGTATFVWSVVQ